MSTSMRQRLSDSGVSFTANMSTSWGELSDASVVNILVPLDESGFVLSTLESVLISPVKLDGVG